MHLCAHTAAHWKASERQVRETEVVPQRHGGAEARRCEGQRERYGDAGTGGHGVTGRLRSRDTGMSSPEAESAAKMKT